MTPHFGKFVAYYRVSTKRQGASGLGLDAQQQRVSEYLNGGDWELVGEFSEAESGKKSDAKRPELKKAIAMCRSQNAKLIVATTDRLGRNLPLLTRLLESNLEIVAADVPMGDPINTRYLLQNLANAAERDGAIISERVTNALAQAKKRGVELGNPNVTKIQKRGVKGNEQSADEFAREVGPIIRELEKYGCDTLEKIKAGLEARGIRNRRDKTHWSLSSIRNLRLRYEELRRKK